MTPVDSSSYPVVETDEDSSKDSVIQTMSLTGATAHRLVPGYQDFEDVVKHKLVCMVNLHGEKKKLKAARHYPEMLACHKLFLISTTIFLLCMCLDIISFV